KLLRPSSPSRMQTPAISLAICERSKCSLTKNRFGMADPPPSRGSSMILDTATAHMTSSTSALTGWHVRNALCSFYLPKESTKAQLLEAKANLLRLRHDIPLADAELSAVEDGLAAYE